MKPELIQAFMIKNADCFEPFAAQDIQNKLADIDDSKAALLMGQTYQSPTIMFIVAIVLGWERFFLDDIALGIVKVITCYGFGIWWLVDLFTVYKRTRNYNYKKFNELLLLVK